MWLVRLRSAVSFFFFQAEDGIRDDLVTGVQTCALPILALTQAGRAVATARPACVSATRRSIRWRASPGKIRHSSRRSEERRVGKECKSRWWAERRKNKSLSGGRCVTEDEPRL